MSEQYTRNRKLSDTLNNSYYDASKYNYQNHTNQNAFNQTDNEYKANSYLNNRQDPYLDQSTFQNYNQNANIYDEFNQFDNRNSQNYSDYPFRSEINLTKGWDVFAAPPPPENDETLDSNIYKLFIKFLKICAYLVTFSVVLTCSIISKSSLLFMTSLIKPNKTGISVCSQGIPGLDRDKRYETIFQLNDPERVAWIWSLLFVLILPEILTLFRSIRICTFKSFKRPKSLVFCTVFLMETLHTIGLVIFVFAVLPELNVIKGAMLTNCLCFVPGVLAVLSRNSNENMYYFKLIADVLAILGQISAFIFWFVIDNDSSNIRYSLPLSCILISCQWWENYCEDTSPINFIRVLAEMKECLNKSRYIIYVIVSSWKIFLLIIGTFIVRLKIDGSSLYLLTQFRNAFSQHKVLIARDRAEASILNENTDGIEGEWLELDVFGTNALKFVFIQIAATWLAYVFGKFACKICIQGFSFTLALILTVPITIVLFTTSCDVHLTDNCSLISILPRHLFWTCPNDSNINYDSFMNTENTLWIIWIMSQIWICFHICKPKCERLATTEKLFINPMYCAAFIDQSMMLNRRRNDLFVLKFEHLNLDKNERTDFGSETQHYETISEPADEKKTTKSPVKKEDYVTKILVCATMWHETKEEMMQMLKSVFRMDEDQCAKKNAINFFKIKIPDYYEFEVHIFFDDAFEYAEDCDEMEVNRFVKKFFSVLDEAASNVHQTEIRIKPPKKYPTPYGGRLEWTLPGGNKLIVHLKNKEKIRHRKRWSQVMYMYYLLGHRLMELPIEVSRKSVKAENTYILALDGDINFRPGAVQLLVDLMKKNRKLGAACGRIHPVGSGPMVWYQKFEYAIGHWLQKATEHMIGCVLCSPGCFSLFRAKALMDDNVMRKYATKAEEALHYVQYDQGEDRWLCTLLLQRGYRVEYSAASDAYTHCPEGFGEFFTQRRRWAPSTMANIMDLLGDYKRTVAVNDNISLPYIIYQGMLMVGTVLGPGTIFLMLVGALVAVFRISNWYSFQLNLIPILIFMIVCFTMKNNYQILAAQFLSACYALLMMAVFVGTSIQMTEDGISSPSAMFFIALTGTFFVAAMLHPQEFNCVVPIILYFLSIPSMYLLLIVYSLINLNVVTWGTREIEPRKKKIKPEEEKKAKEELKKKTLLDYFNQNLKDEEEESGITFSLANLFKCMFFTYPKPNEEKIHLIQIEQSLDTIRKQIKNIEKSLPNHNRRRLSSSMSNTNKTKSLEVLNENNDDLMSQDSMRIENDTDDSDLSLDDNKIQRDDMVNPYWIEDKDLLNGEICQLPEKEIVFWKDLIKKYLHPLEENKEAQDKIAADLIELRNRVVFAFLMVNALFILIVFLLQLNKDILYVQWPFGVRENITFIPETNEIRVEKHYLEMEPIGLVFVLFFGTILVIQFVGMLFHRFATLSHILASVELFETKKNVSTENELKDNGAAIALHFQRLKGINDDDKSSSNGLANGNIVERLEGRKLQKRGQINTLDVAFRKRFQEFSQKVNDSRSEDKPTTPILGIRNSETIKELKKKGNFLFNDQNSRNGTLDGKNEFVRMTKNRSTLDNKNARKNGNTSNSKKPSSSGKRSENSTFTNPTFNNMNEDDNEVDTLSMNTMNYNPYDVNERRSKKQYNSQM